jgi:hypothetical protein
MGQVFLINFKSLTVDSATGSYIASYPDRWEKKPEKKRRSLIRLVYAELAKDLVL